MALGTWVWLPRHFPNHQCRLSRRVWRGRNLLLANTRRDEDVLAVRARASTNTGLHPRFATQLLVATSGVFPRVLGMPGRVP